METALGPVIQSTLTRGGRQKGSSPSANYSSGSKATNPLGRWSLYDADFKYVHQENEEALWAHFTLLGAFKCVHPAREEAERDPTSLHLNDAAFKCVHQENEEAVLAHFTSLGAFKCVHPASELKWSWCIVVTHYGAFC